MHSRPASLQPRSQDLSLPAPPRKAEKRGDTLGTTRALLIRNKFITLPKSFRNDFHSATSSLHHIFLLRFSTKTFGKEAKVHRIITRYHEVARRRLWFVVVFKFNIWALRMWLGDLYTHSFQRHWNRKRAHWEWNQESESTVNNYKRAGPRQVLGTTQGEKMWMISDERLYEGVFKFTW